LSKYIFHKLITHTYTRTLMKHSKIGGEKFSKTLSLPVRTWANLEEVRSLTRMPDLSIALQDCIDSKHEALLLVEKMKTRLEGSDKIETE